MFSLLAASAFATTFTTVPSTSVMNYTWGSPGSPIAAGTTTYNFTTSVSTSTSGTACSTFPGLCRSGAFTTGNGGEGMYTTTGSISCFFFGYYCEATQNVTFTYDGTTALYTGSGLHATGTYNFGSSSYDITIVNGNFDGTMVASGTTGIFFEP